MKANVTRQARDMRLLKRKGLCPNCWKRPHGQGVLCEPCRAKSGSKPWRPGGRGPRPMYATNAPVLSDRQSELVRCYGFGQSRAETVVHMGVSVFYVKLLVNQVRKRLKCEGISNEDFRSRLRLLCEQHPKGNIPSIK
jgi:DNA-binding CsgD family transcriptional regulator